MVFEAVASINLRPKESTTYVRHTHIKNALIFVEDQLRDVLLKLPQTAVDICIRLYTSGALELSEEQKVYRVGLLTMFGL